MSEIVDTLEPVGERFLVMVDAEIEDLGSGLIAPEKHREVQQLGTVVKCGPEVPEDIAEGQRIIFSKYSGMDFGIEGEIGPGRQSVKMMMPIDVLGYIADDA